MVGPRLLPVMELDRMSQATPNVISLEAAFCLIGLVESY